MREPIRLSLRWKIAGGFGLLVALIVLLGWVTLSLFESTRAVQRRVFDRAIPQLVAVDEVIRSFTAQSNAIRGYVISTDRELVVEYTDEVQIAAAAQTRALRLPLSRAERLLFQRLIETGADFHALVDDQVIPLAEEGQRAQAFRVLDQEGTPLINEIGTIGRELRLLQDQVVAQAEENVRLRQNQVVLILVALLIAALAVGLLLAILLPRRLVADLQALVEAARGIARGDFDQKIEIRSGDEVEELAVRFDDMQSGLKRLQQLALQDRELEIAASIQRNLLQRSIPRHPAVRLVPVQRQANLVGGDWYDFDIDLESDQLTVVIGDASGKGIAAALMATVALSALRAERALGARPSQVVHSANRALLDATDPDSFSTVVYLVVDVATGVAKWLNMGHISPFLLERDGDSYEGRFLEGAHNRALGWFDDPGLQVSEHRLNPGDRLVLFTDGFSEAKGLDGELFGDERVASTLLGLAPFHLEKMGQDMVAQVERFAAGKLDDDLTMLLIEYTGPTTATSDGADIA